MICLALLTDQEPKLSQILLNLEGQCSIKAGACSKGRRKHIYTGHSVRMSWTFLEPKTSGFRVQ
jgi:hypothetical protein